VAMTTVDLGDALEAFILNHEYCGELDAAVEADRVWMTCTCGAGIVRDADRATDSRGRAPSLVRVVAFG
jgi:hypothetical protein